MEFQVRVSSECMYYFSLLEEIYSKEFTGIVTRGMILSKAFEETKHLNNWLEINNDTLTIPLHNIEYSNFRNLIFLVYFYHFYDIKNP